MKKTIKIILIFVIIIIIGLSFGIILYKIDNNSLESSLQGFSCLAKGKKCSKEDIKAGMLLDIPVNNKEKVPFYVLSDTEDSVTLITKNLYGEKVAWGGYTNKQGPYELFNHIYELTKKWTNIPVIKDYAYEDYGYKYYYSVCIDKSIEDESFKCNNAANGVGYRSISIDQGKVYIVNSDNSLNTLEIKNLRARTVSYEEVQNVSYFTNNEKIDWLYNGMYWTISSATFSTANYFTSAFIVSNVNYDGNPTFYTKKINIETSNNTVKFRPVITIAKYTDK